MFWHLYKYRLKSFLKSKEETFWSFLFPIILCTCFVIAFSDISKSSYTFHSIPVAVVYQQENETFKQALDSVADDDSQGEAFLKVQETSLDSAKKLLDKNKIDAIILVNDSIEMIVNDSDINQTAVNSFINQYLQTETLINDMAQSSPQELLQLIARISEETDYIEHASLSDNVADPMTAYYFSLIGMAALFGCYFGLKCARQMKADITPEGLRKCISPVSRPVLVVTEFMASFTIHLCAMTVLLFYMKFIMRINLGNQIGYVFLTCVIGSLFGISSGIFVGSIPHIKESIQNGIVTFISLVSSFFSGLMMEDIKMLVQIHAPWFAKINPGTLIQDSLYSLLIYNTHDRYFENMLALTILSVILCIASVLMTRRTTYANI